MDYFKIIGKLVKEFKTKTVPTVVLIPKTLWKDFVYYMKNIESDKKDPSIQIKKLVAVEADVDEIIVC